ncbi:unnamed protein product [Paramecium primaurelia]|uniref:Protein translocase subunit SecA n=1 Tax=Paramecium primaurelia TaxID=5886 RepID=A0A8S1QAS8_PARPR|nr:unnamed protein product [Paramecium primaurelia]
MSSLMLDIKQVKDAQKIIDHLKSYNKDWRKLQEDIQKEISNQIQVECQQERQQIQWNPLDLMKLKNKLSQSFKNNEEINFLLQYIQKKQSQEILNLILCSEFNSLSECLKLISKITNKKQPQQNKGILKMDEIKIDRSIKENQQIKDLFSKFQSLNKRSNYQINQQLEQLYNTLEQQQQNFQVSDFNSSPQLEYEDLLYLCKNVNQHFSYYPRPVQLLSVIELYNHQDKKGRLAQINTGEGKTLIVAMLAILLCKKKKLNVDIVTSSPVLAIRDANDLAPFYQLFSVSVAHNINEQPSNLEEMLPCYKSQVIYGDPHSFQADILRHKYSELGTMGDRQQGYIIIDEVDAMLIDGNSHKTLLSTPIPGMLDLTKILRLIWDEICKSEPNLSTDRKVMIIDGKDYYCIDLVDYVQKALDIQIKEALQNQIPAFRLNYINFMKKLWIENAVMAKYDYHENQHYLIDNNNVRIIDYQNTGVVHKNNTQWQKGLHQFIQLKHGLSITPLKISTKLLSNVGFFNRYKHQLLGLTGTLGSQITQNLLAKKYNVDFVFMPPYKQSLLKVEPGIAAQGENEWFEEISKGVLQQLEKKRAVLIINRTIEDVHKIEGYLKNYNIKSTTYVDDNQQISKEIGPNQIIIATNLAGRGTDLTANKELETNGGLHVIMSFLPRFGRAGRQGQQGTAQLIVNFQTNLYLGTLNQIKTPEDAISYYKNNQKQQNYTYLDVLIFFRDLNEQQYSNEIEEEMDKLQNEDKCFEKFFNIAKTQVNIKTHRAEYLALEEKWGLYLEQNQDKGIKEDEIESVLISKEVQNPKNLIYQGLQNGDLNIFKKAAEIAICDPQVYYFKGLFEIQNEEIQNGIQSLQQAKSLFNNKIDDEKGFATAAKLNRIQVDSFQEKQQINKPSQTNIQQEDSQMKKLNLINDSKNQKISAVQFLEQSKVSKDAVDQKIQNHLKVYQKAIDNIDELLNTLKNFQSEKEELNLSWQPVITKEEKENAESEQSIKDQQEVIDDGPLPQFGKLTKIKKEKKWGDYIAMFAIGLGQFVIGCGICAFTCGVALPIGKALITEGISDMIYSVTAAWKGIDIDWGAWGKQKSINIATSLALAGQAGIQEALKLGGSMIKSLKKIGLSEFLQKIPSITREGLEKAGFWLTNQEKKNLQNQHETLQKITDSTKNVDNQTQILNVANQIIQNQKNLGLISESTASEILQLINLCSKQSQGTVEGFNNSLVQASLKFIKLQMAKAKSEKNVYEIKKDLVEICQREGNKKYDQVKNDIQQYNQFKQALNNELQKFSNIIWNYFKQDQEVQKKIIFLDLYFELFCDQQQVQKIVTNNIVQSHLQKYFSIHNKTVQNACNQVQISNPHSMNQFYQIVMRPSITQTLNDLRPQILYTEPLEIVFQQEYLNKFLSLQQQSKIMKNDLEIQQKELKYQQDLITRRIQNSSSEIMRINQAIEQFNFNQELIEQLLKDIKEIQNFQNEQFVKELICNMKNKGMIYDDGISFSPKFQQEFKNFLMKQNFNKRMKDITQQAMESSLNLISKINQTSNKTLTNKLLEAIEVEMIDQVKKLIFDLRMQNADTKITSKFN